MRSILAVCLLAVACGQEPNATTSSIESYPPAYRNFHPSTPSYLPPLEAEGRIRDESYPSSPDHSVTPGTLCSRPDHYRYPEKIAYCGRHVSSGAKAAIFVTYEKIFGFSTHELGRHNFKIDHYIPLCMGGGNESKNLWPQFKTIYVHTDPLEGKLCSLMAEGKMKQVDAVQLIKTAKADPESSGTIMQQLEAL